MTRISFAVCIVAVLGVTQDVVGSQAPGSVTLVDVSIPVYPPIAQAALVDGDVHVTVEVRADGTVTSASVVKVEGFSHKSITEFLGPPALAAARNAQFRCEACGETSRSYSLLFSFRFANRIGRAEGDVHPELVSISPSRSRVLIVTQMRLISGPVSEVERERAARCLWLWHCKIYKEPDVGEPELALRSVTVPVYPVAARADMASADIEIRVAVRRDGKVVSAEIGTTRNVVSSNQGIESAFQKAAVSAARQATFFCARCRQGNLPYSIIYAFRFDGVLAPLDAGYAAGGITVSSASQARVSVPADVRILEAALNVRADALRSVCRLAPAQPAGGDIPVTVNPWAGDDKHLISLVHARIAGRAGSDPPSPYELQLAKGVRQAYVARYVDGDREATAVYGLLFGDENDARAFAGLGAKSGSTFLVHRQIVVAVRGGNSCADVVAASIKKQ